MSATEYESTIGPLPAQSHPRLTRLAGARREDGGQGTAHGAVTASSLGADTERIRAEGASDRCQSARRRLAACEEATVAAPGLQDDPDWAASTTPDDEDPGDGSVEATDGPDPVWVHWGQLRPRLLASSAT